MLNSVLIPPAVDDLAVRKQLLDEFGIEIGSGLGPLKGKTWRHWTSWAKRARPPTSCCFWRPWSGASPDRAEELPAVLESRQPIRFTRPDIDASSSERTL